MSALALVLQNMEQKAINAYKNGNSRTASKRRQESTLNTGIMSLWNCCDIAATRWWALNFRRLARPVASELTMLSLVRCYNVLTLTLRHVDFNWYALSWSVSACPAGCDCNADFSCETNLYNAIVCHTGYVTTGATCVGETTTLSVCSVILSFFFDYAF